MQEAFVRTTINAAGIATITFFHPQSNSMPGSQLAALAAEIEKAGNNPEAKVIVLRSEGEKAFCAGASFDELISITCRTCPKFIIGRVQGKAVGGGVGVASAVDYCLATKYADIKLSELAVGIGPFVVGPAVERKIGLSAMSELAINATEWRPAEWAKRKGLYTDVFENEEDMDKEITRLSQQLAKSNPEAMMLLKKVFWQGTDHWNELLIERAEISGKLVLSEFTRNAINAFKKK